MDERHLYAAIRYVENNPVKAGIVRSAGDYLWSSARAHLKNLRDPVLSKNYLDREGRIERCVTTGRPCGDELFQLAIKDALVKSVLARPRGRPIKTNK